MPSPLSVLIVVAFFGLLALVVYNDVRELRIPNGIPLSLLALYPAYVLLAAPGAGGWLAVAIAAGVLVLGMAAFSAELVGGGDVKLLAVLTLWAGPAGVVDLVVITAIVGGGMALLMLESDAPRRGHGVRCDRRHRDPRYAARPPPAVRCGDRRRRGGEHRPRRPLLDPLGHASIPAPPASEGRS